MGYTVCKSTAIIMDLQNEYVAQPSLICRRFVVNNAIKLNGRCAPHSHTFIQLFTPYLHALHVYIRSKAVRAKRKKKKKTITMHTRLETRGSREVQARSLRKQ